MAFNSKSQSIFFSLSSAKQGEELYLNGNKLAEIGKFKEADSMFTLALCTYKNENIYYNRGISRLYRNDTSGFCDDMNMAANKYFDADARLLFNTLCCSKVDTIYLDKKYLITNSLNYKYLEEIQYIRNSGERIGTIHERGRKTPLQTVDYGCEQNLLSMKTVTTDIIASYLLVDSIQVFFKSTYTPIILKTNQYQEIKKKAASLFALKYKNLKEQNQADQIKVFFEITISDLGNIIEGKYLAIFPEIAINGYEKELKNDIQDILQHYPKFKPAKFKGESVNFKTFDVIVF